LSVAFKRRESKRRGVGKLSGEGRRDRERATDVIVGDDVSVSWFVIFG
jgi:hypothetical protein